VSAALRTMEAARGLLAQVFGYPDFRPGQAEAIEALLEGRDAAVLLPTGSGKSLCYQVPALVMGRAGLGTTVVVSPLIALMQDQVGALAGRGVRAAALHSHQDAAAQGSAVAGFLAGSLDLLYVSPERAAKQSFRRMWGRVPVALLAIDEAHCVSQWGHDFRPDYLRIHELRELCEAPAIALTATATPRVMAEIEEHLCLRRPVRVSTGFERSNLAFGVRRLRTQAERLAVLQAELETAGLRGRKGPGRGIVYCSTRKTVETVAKALRSAGFAVGFYHAGRARLARERAQMAFEAGRTRILVATNAFGMGIDIPDIRMIVHFQTPGSIEAYYQEAGRAGRDGLPARCLLFYGASDLATQRRLSGASATSAVLERRREDALAAIQRYATSDHCRQRELVAHFVGETGDGVCGLCDACCDEVVEAAEQAPATPPDAQRRTLPEQARETILTAVGRLSRPVGRSNLARALRGSRAKSLSRGGLLTMPEYGQLAEYEEAEIVAAIDGLLADGRLRRTGRKYPTLWLPDKPIRSARSPKRAGQKRGGRYGGDIARALDNYRRRAARDLGWKTYMVFQRSVILAVDRQQPDTREALERIPGLGPAKIERFGADILALVRQHR